MTSSASSSQKAADQAADAEIVGRILAGQCEEYGVLVTRYYRLVQGKLASRWGMRGAQLDDAVQDTFVRAYIGLQRLRDANCFGAYLMTIADRVPVRPRQKEVPLDRFDPAAQPEADQSWREVLQQAIAQLPDGLQFVLALKYGERLTAKAIAERLGQTVGTVTKTLSRAYEMLRKDPRLADLAEESERP